VAQRDSVPGQFFARADPRKKQQLRRAERAAGDDGLAPRAKRALRRFDANAGLGFEQQAQRVRAADHVEIGAPGGGIEVRACGAPAPAVLLRDLVKAYAFLVRSVEVRVARTPGLHTRLHERQRSRLRRTHFRDVQRAAGAVERIGAALIVLAALEHRQHVGPAPAGISGRGPVVVVARVTAHVDHRVYRARSAERPAARLIAPAPGEPGLRRRFERPVVDFARHRDREQDRRVDQRRAPIAPRLD